MKKLVLASAILLAFPVALLAGPKEDAFQVIERFKKAFDASDVQGVVALFAPDALFLGTLSPKLATTPQEFDAYFEGLKQFMPRSVNIETYGTIVLSDNAVLFAGMDVFGQTRDSKTVETPARFTFLITKNDQGWRISHFHSSVRPN
jgi:uncharacterized protein (TIGR02246 family)